MKYWVLLFLCSVSVYAADDTVSFWQEKVQQDPKNATYRFNLGNACYRAKDFEGAQRAYSGLETSDLQFHAQTFHNLGNALFFKGEGLEDRAAKIAAWEESVKDYGSALELDPDNQETRHNCDIVKKKLEEQQKQQEKEQKDKKDKQNQDQPNSDKPKNENQESQKPEDKPNKPEENKQNPEENKQNQPQSKEEKPQQQPAQPQPKPGEMTKDEAEQMLNAMQKDEKQLPLGNPQKPPSTSHKKPW